MAERISDVCFILEGTYPYISGGVSSWVHQIITSLPDIKFSILIIMPEKRKSGYKYAIPPNVNEIKELYLSGKVVKPPLVGSLKKKDFKNFEDLLYALKSSDLDRFSSAIKSICENKDEYTPEKIIFSFKLWQHMEEDYKRNFSGMSFIDYFWSWRFMHLGIIRSLQAQVPRAKVYHTVCTGYAGFIGAMVKASTSRPLMLTEHGIYTRERQVEISMADWIYEKETRVLSVSRGVGTFREVWIDFFRLLSSICYQSCDDVITLYRGNQRYQIEEGADPARMQIIPNGVDVNQLARLIREDKPRPFKVALVGRVVPVKDIKTYIRAMREVCSQLPEVEAYVLGDYTEDPDYFQECRDLVRMLELDKQFFFVGDIDMNEWFPRIHLMVLTSISEGQPLVILEANAAGIPVVATDVGACRELLTGASPEDEALGQSGITIPLSSSHDTARAISAVLMNSSRYKSMVQAGIQRVQKYYNKEDFQSQYNNLYKKHIKQGVSPWQA